MENNEKEVLFSVSHLKKYFQVGNHATLKAVDDVSFEIYKGETLGMVGESGCGKTTCGRTCIGLYDKTDGQVLYKGTDVHALNGKERFAFKKQVQMVFQDPYGSLDPRMTVADIIGEGIDIHHLAKNKKERQEMIYKYLELVGLNREHANRFVHEFSGGQRQRIGIARALAVLERNEAYRTLCAEYVQLLQTQYMRSNNGQTRIKLMTFGIESESVKGARSRLTRIGLDMQGKFKKIGVESVLMDGKERLSLLTRCFTWTTMRRLSLSGRGCRKPDYPPKTSSRPAVLISRRPVRLRSGKRIAPRRTSRFKRRA